MGTRIKEKTLSNLIKELDLIFGTYIKLRDADGSGTVTCFVTGERVWWMDADAAHFMGRANMPTRYHEQNVHACTQDTNRYDSDHMEKYAIAMLKKYGAEFSMRLAIESRKLQKFTRNEILDLIDLYTDKVKILRKEKGI